MSVILWYDSSYVAGLCMTFGDCKVSCDCMILHMQLDSYVQGFQVLKRRRDVVFAQAVSCMSCNPVESVCCLQKYYIGLCFIWSKLADIIAYCK